MAKKTTELHIGVPPQIAAEIRKVASLPEEKDLVPLKAKAVTSKNPAPDIPSYVSLILGHFAPHLIPAALEKLRVKIARGDLDAIKFSMGLFGVGGGKGSNIVFHNHVTAQANAAAAASQSGAAEGPRGFDAFMRRRDEQAKERIERQRIIEASSTTVE